MLKTKSAAAAGKAESEKPYELMTSADLELEVESRKVTPRVPGPQTGEVQRSPGQWLEHYGTPEELRAFKSVIETRLKAAPADQWRMLPDGTKILATLVLAGCPSPPGCGRWFWTKQPDGPCVCNLRGAVGRGHLRPATPEEEAAWFARETAALARFKADAPRRQAEVDAFNRRRFEDGKV
jgi:hypothetical protein